MNNPWDPKGNPYFEGTTYTDTYIMTLEQDGQQVKMTVSAEAIAGNPKWVFEEFMRQLSEKQREHYHRVKSDLFAYGYGKETSTVKAEAMRLDKPAEIGPANGD